MVLCIKNMLDQGGPLPVYVWIKKLESGRYHAEFQEPSKKALQLIRKLTSGKRAGGKENSPPTKKAKAMDDDTFDDMFVDGSQRWP